MVQGRPRPITILAKDRSNEPGIKETGLRRPVADGAEDARALPPPAHDLAQATLVAVVRRVLAEAPATMPAVFLSTTFWERIRRERGHRQTWRAYANQFQRAHGARTPQAALAALRALAPPRPTA